MQFVWLAFSHKNQKISIALKFKVSEINFDKILHFNTWKLINNG